MVNSIVRKTITKAAIYCCCMFFYNLALAKELFVATTGNDNVTYENNDINQPWKTITKGIYSLQAGDTLNIRGGTYLQANPLTIYSQSRNSALNPNLNILMNAQTGTADNPITVKNYNGEIAIIDLANANTFLNVDNKSYWTFDGLKFINAGVVFAVGDDAISQHNSFVNLTIDANRGYDNVGVITTKNENAEYTKIENNKITGVAGSGIRACIYSRRVRHLKVLNNECRNTEIGFFYKHRTHTAEERGETAPVDIEIAYNLIENSSVSAMYINTRGARIHDNIIGVGNPNGIVNTEASGDTGGDYNVYEHNTFFTGSVNFLSDTQPSTDPRTYAQYPDAYPGSMYNTLKNNIFVYEPALHWYSSNMPHNTISNYNLFGPTKAIRSNGVTYVTLSSWKAASNQDANSLQGTPVFVGGSTPSTIAGYALTSGSPGYRKASDGKDMGADITKVGVAGSLAVEANPLPLDFIN